MWVDKNRETLSLTIKKRHVKYKSNSIDSYWDLTILTNFKTARQTHVWSAMSTIIASQQKWLGNSSIVNVSKNVIIKCQSNPVSYFQVTGTLKTLTKNFNLKIVVKKIKVHTHDHQKWVNCELKITIFSKKGLDTIANAMKNE